MGADDIPSGTWVFGGPLAGKSYLARLLRSRNRFVVETDEAMREMPGMDRGLWNAWRPSNPRHSEWLKVWRQHMRQLHNLREHGAIVIAHDPSAQVPMSSQLLLHPGEEELKSRATLINDPSRLDAFDHWWKKAAARGWLQKYRHLNLTQPSSR